MGGGCRLGGFYQCAQKGSIGRWGDEWGYGAREEGEARLGLGACGRAWAGERRNMGEKTLLKLVATLPLIGE